MLRSLCAFTIAVMATATTAAFEFPTDNRLGPGREEAFFAPTPGRSWTAGQYGCVRSEGTQMHEGIDILFTRRDANGEPLDDVRATAAGEVVHVNRRAALSNYGIYIVVRHRIDSLEAFSLYAHLSEVAGEIAPGVRVRAGQRLGRMGRTANTRTPIAKYRAHLHFEITLMLNDRFDQWLLRDNPKARNDHGPWNGRNLLGLDPAAILAASAREPSFSLLEFVRNRPEMCRVLIAKTDLPWLRRYPRLIRRNPVAESQGIAAYEASLDFSGVPFRLVPRARSEIEGPLSTRLLHVNEDEYRRHPCRNLVFKRGQQWTLTSRGRELLDLLTY